LDDHLDKLLEDIFSPKALFLPFRKNIESLLGMVLEHTCMTQPCKKKLEEEGVYCKILIQVSCTLSLLFDGRVSTCHEISEEIADTLSGSLLKIILDKV
jgi:hypothetical protein